jgi:hypothetical protein
MIARLTSQIAINQNLIAISSFLQSARVVAVVLMKILDDGHDCSKCATDIIDVVKRTGPHTSG